MLSFKSWFLVETVSGLRGLLDKGNQVISWGKIAGWDVYSAVFAPFGPQKQIYPFSATNIQGMHYDPAVDKAPLIKTALTESRQRLAYLGFRRMGGIIVFADPTKVGAYADKDRNVGGYHSPSRHYILVDERSDDKKYMVEIIVHEHSHAFWDNVMTKEQKALFIDWFKTNVEGAVNKMFTNPDYEDRQQLDKVLPRRLSDDSMMGKIQIGLQLRRNAGNFVHGLVETLGFGRVGYEDLYRFMNLRKSIREGQSEEMIIANALVRGWGSAHPVPVIARQDISVFSMGRQKDIKTGEQVRIFKSGTYFIITKDNYDKKVEGDSDEILKYVQFDESLLTPEQKEELKKQLKMAKQSWSTILAPPSKKSEIMADLQHALEEIRVEIPMQGAGKASLAKIFPAGNYFFNTWKSLLGRRSKKIDEAGSPDESIKVIHRIFYDTVMKKIDLIDFTRDPDVMKNLSSRATTHLGTKDGDWLRNYIHSKGITPSAYGATNYQELWTTTVEAAAFNLQSVHPELKKLLFQVAK